MKPKRITSYRLSEKSRTFLKALSDEDDMSQTMVLEILIKEEAKRREMNYEEMKEMNYGDNV